jgi:hypothetical protein
MSEYNETMVGHEDQQPQSSNEGSNGGSSLFSLMSRALPENDLQSPITARFLLSQYDEYLELKSQHEKLRTAFYEKDKQCAVYEEKRSKSIAFEIISSAMLTIGPLLLGLLSSLVPKHGWEPITIIVLVAGVLLSLGGIVAKCFMRCRSCE